MKNVVYINEKYLHASAKLIDSVNYLKSTDFNDLCDGKININKKIWANIQTYMTKEDALFEAHRKYIDIQFIIAGHEKIEIDEYSNCKENIPYNEENDIEFLTSDSKKFVDMNTGDFIILYPSDAHKPSISLNKQIPTHVRKIVIKVPIN